MDDAGDFIKDPTTFTALTKIHKQPVLDCCFAPDTYQILSGSEDNTVVLWVLPPTDTELHDDTINDEHKLVCFRLSDHKSPVMSVAMHKKVFLSASKDGYVKLWKLFKEPARRSHQQPFKKPSSDPITYTCHTRIMRSACFDPDGHYFATGSDDGSVKIWSTECPNKMLVSFLDGHKNWIKGVRWSKTNDSLLASCGDDGKILIWDARTKIRSPPVQSISSKRKMQFNCLDWHPVFDHHIATGAQDSSCVVWDLRNGKQVQIYVEHNGSINSVAFNPGGSLLLSGSSDKTSKIFDVCEGRNMFTLKSHTAPVTSVGFSHDGELFITGSQDKTITVWKRNFDTMDIVLDDETEEIYESLEEYSSDPGSSIPFDLKSRERSQTQTKAHRSYNYAR